jgi:hypothetical protein
VTPSDSETSGLPEDLCGSGDVCSVLSIDLWASPLVMLPVGTTWLFCKGHDELVRCRIQRA